MLSEAALVALIRRFQASLATVAERTAFAMAIAWDRLGSYDESDVAHYVEATASATVAGKAASVRLAGGFYAALGSSTPVGVDPATIPVELATRDPFIAYWTALKVGKQWREAVISGRDRAETAGVDLVNRTARSTAGAVTEVTEATQAVQRIVGWRRVLTGSSCAWCATVATQRYHSADSAAFGHHHCDCTITPIYGDRDPGQVINKPVLDVLRQRGQGYWKSGYVNPDGSPAPRADAVVVDEPT